MIDIANGQPRRCTARAAPVQARERSFAAESAITQNAATKTARRPTRLDFAEVTE